MSKFTPGEWRVSNYRPYEIVQVGNSDDNDAYPGKRYIGRVDDINENAQANARLIASAPDLLEALKNLVFTATKLWEQVSPIKNTETMTITHPMIEVAKEAIAKAETK